LAQAWSRHSARYPSKGALWSWANQTLNRHYGASQCSLLLRALEVKLSSLLRRVLGDSQFSLHCRPQGDSQSSHHHRAAQANLCNNHQPTYGDVAFGSPGAPFASGQRIAPANN
jgi:hypothetical protein